MDLYPLEVVDILVNQGFQEDLLLILKKMTKYFLTAALFIGMMSTAFAQCDTSIISLDVDQFTGKANWSSAQNIVLSPDGVEGMGMYLIMSDDKHKTLIWVTTSTKAGCIDKGDKVELVFKDETRMTLYAENNFNCKGKATCYFGGIFGKKTEMQKLASTPISMIRVHGSTTLHSETFSEETAQYFMTAFSCLVQQRDK